MSRYNQLVKDAFDELERANDALTDELELVTPRMLVAMTTAETYATLALADAVHRIALSKGAH